MRKLIKFIFLIVILFSYKVNADTTPTLITPYYNTNHFIVADYVVSPSSGDMTSKIKNALNQCKSDGGGTVWLERGIYNVSKPITIPSGCTLMGDWQDPDNYQGTLDYGTKIVVDVKKFESDSTKLEKTGLFKLQPSSGVEGLTIYYKNQSISNPIEQPWTFHYYFHGKMLYTIKNVTMINSYQGIGCSTNEEGAHEMLMIENVKGTVLKKGVLIHNSADVGTITGLSLTPKYLADANLSAFGDSSSNSSEKSISKAIKNNDGIGMMLTDAEQSQFVNVTLAGFKYGIYIPDASVIKSRLFGSGVFYNLNISDCKVGIKVENGINSSCGYKGGCSMIDQRWGYLISNSSIEGSSHAIYTDSPSIGGLKGTIKLNNVSIKGKVDGIGQVLYNKNDGSYESVPKNVDQTGIIKNSGKLSKLNTYRKYKNNETNFKYLSAGTSVDKINSALSTISSKGGGVVYLKPGVYKINKSIVVPKNVELRGSSATPTRLFSIGTTFNVVSNIRAIKIAGNNAGVSGINIIYENNVNKLKVGSNYDQYDYSIFIQNVKNIYVKNITIAAGSHGIYLKNCSSFSIGNITTGILDNVLRIDDSTGGYINNFLQNGNVITRNTLFPIDEASTVFQNIMRPNTYNNLNQIVVNNSKDIELQNIFAFGIKRSITSSNSTIYAVNIGKDATDGYLIDSNKSNIVLVNSLVFGTINGANGSNLAVYNISSPGKITTSDTMGTVFSVSKKYVTPVLTVSKSSVSLDSSSNKNVKYTYDGDGKLSCKSSDTKYVKCSINDNNEVVIKPVKELNSDITLTVSAAKGQNYSSKSVTITVSKKKSSATSTPKPTTKPTSTATPKPTAKPTSTSTPKPTTKPTSTATPKPATTPNSPTTETYPEGDIDGDGKTRMQDYVLLRNHIIEKQKSSPNSSKLLTGGRFTRADLDHDGELKVKDYTLLRNIIRNS